MINEILQLEKKNVKNVEGKKVLHKELSNDQLIN
jgi:hypothetical protein